MNKAQWSHCRAFQTHVMCFHRESSWEGKLAELHWVIASWPGPMKLVFLITESRYHSRAVSANGALVPIKRDHQMLWSEASWLTSKKGLFKITIWFRKFSKGSVERSAFQIDKSFSSLKPWRERISFPDETKHHSSPGPNRIKALRSLLVVSESIHIFKQTPLISC